MSNLTSFQEQQANLAATLAGQTMNGNPMTAQSLSGQQVISPNGELTAQSLAGSSNCAKPNTILSKFSSKPNDLSKLDMMEIKQSIQQQKQATAVCLNSVVQSLKRSPVDSRLEMQQQQQRSPLCNSESSSVKSSISPGTSLSSSPTHSTNGYSNVYMLRNSILNEPTISINQSQTSTIPLNTFLNGNTFFQPDKEDSRPIAIVQGKKNRHNLNEDEDETVGSIKKFCVNGTNLNSGNQMQAASLQQPPPQDNSSSPSDFRYLMQNAVQNTFGGLANGTLTGGNLTGNLGNNLGNNLQQTPITNPNNPTSLACNQQQQQQQQQPSAGNSLGNSLNTSLNASPRLATTTYTEPQANQQRTDQANFFSAACCSNAHEDCKPAPQQEYRCGQRHATADFRYLI